jgi:large subunit ribosomal protein L18
MANVIASKRDRRRARIRAKVSGTAERPRLSVFKSNTALTVQLVDDMQNVTIAHATGKDASKVGEAIAKAAKGKGVEKVVFDRGGYIYTGKVRALAEAARAGGLSF